MNNNPVFTSTPTVGSTATKNLTNLDTDNLYPDNVLMPAEHMDYFLGNLTSNSNIEQTATINCCDEISGVLASAGIARNPSQSDQMAQATTILMQRGLENLRLGNWTRRALPVSATWYAIAWNGTVFCAVAASSTIAATSPDGITWTQRTLPVSAAWYAIAWNGTVFCAVASSSAIAATTFIV